MSVNFLSKGYCITLDTNGCKVIDKDTCNMAEKTVVTAKNANGLYKLNELTERVNVVQSVNR